MESAATPGGRGVFLIAIGAIALWRMRGRHPVRGAEPTAPVARDPS
jgi:hypothetical protein